MKSLPEKSRKTLANVSDTATLIVLTILAIAGTLAALELEELLVKSLVTWAIILALVSTPLRLALLALFFTKAECATAARKSWALVTLLFVAALTKLILL